MLYKHIKSGKHYIQLAIAQNSTNGECNGQLMVVYSPIDNQHEILAKKQEEFETEFELVTEVG